MAIELRKINRWIITTFYVFAGINHFRDPEFYAPLIPDYFPFHHIINVLSGTFEILLGIGFLISSIRPWVARATVVMLVVFIPSHVHFIALGGCVSDGLCVPIWLAWLRLILIHPLLILWAWKSKD